MPTESRHKKPWTDLERKWLSWNWGTIPLSRLATSLKRTPEGVSREARRLNLGRAKRGTMSLIEFARYSGFQPAKIKKSAKILRLNLWHGLGSVPDKRRGDRIRDFSITDDQQDLLLEFMQEHSFVFANEGPSALRTRRGVWGIGKKPTECQRCGRSDKPHYAKGRCKYCYNVVKYKDPETIKSSNQF